MYINQLIDDFVLDHTENYLRWFYPIEWKDKLKLDNLDMSILLLTIKKHGFNHTTFI